MMARAGYDRKKRRFAQCPNAFDQQTRIDFAIARPVARNAPARLEQSSVARMYGDGARRVSLLRFAQRTTRRAQTLAQFCFGGRRHDCLLLEILQKAPQRLRRWEIRRPPPVPCGPLPLEPVGSSGCLRDASG